MALKTFPVSLAYALWAEIGTATVRGIDFIQHDYPNTRIFQRDPYANASDRTSIDCARNYSTKYCRRIDKHFIKSISFLGWLFIN